MQYLTYQCLGLIVFKLNLYNGTMMNVSIVIINVIIVVVVIINIIIIFLFVTVAIDIIFNCNSKVIEDRADEELVAYFFHSNKMPPKCVINKTHRLLR